MRMTNGAITECRATAWMGIVILEWWADCVKSWRWNNERSTYCYKFGDGEACVKAISTHSWNERRIIEVHQWRSTEGYIWWWRWSKNGGNGYTPSDQYILRNAVVWTNHVCWKHNWDWHTNCRCTEDFDRVNSEFVVCHVLLSTYACHCVTSFYAIISSCVTTHAQFFSQPSCSACIVIICWCS